MAKKSVIEKTMRIVGTYPPSDTSIVDPFDGVFGPDVSDQEQPDVPQLRSIDTFTGCRQDFDPEVDAHWSGTPPSLPGADPYRRLHYARGKKSGPQYISPNILSADPIWIKLAYMRFPLDGESLAALLEEMMPTTWFEGNNNLVVQAAEIARWAPELAAIQRLTGRSLQSEYLPFDSASEEEAIQWFTRVFGRYSAKDLIGSWRWLQRLAIFSFWVWGNQHKQPLLRKHCMNLAEQIGRLWHYAHLPVPSISKVYLLGDPKTRRDRADIEGDRAEFARHGDPSRGYWVNQAQVISVARIVEGLLLVVGSAGFCLELCPNCERIFLKLDDRKLFCSPYCRSSFNRDGEKSMKTRTKEMKILRGSVKFSLEDWR